MSKLIPDYVFDSIYDITPALLEQHGVRGVLIDLDGTMASHKAALPEKLRRHPPAAAAALGAQAVPPLL